MKRKFDGSIGRKFVVIEDDDDYGVRVGMTGIIYGEYADKHPENMHYNWVLVEWDVRLPGWGNTLYLHDSKLKFIGITFNTTLSKIHPAIIVANTSDSLWKELIG